MYTNYLTTVNYTIVITIIVGTYCHNYHACEDGLHFRSSQLYRLSAYSTIIIIIIFYPINDCRLWTGIWRNEDMKYFRIWAKRSGDYFYLVFVLSKCTHKYVKYVKNEILQLKIQIIIKNTPYFILLAYYSILRKSYAVYANVKI